MTDEQIDRLISASVVDDDSIAALDLRSGEHELLEEIMSTTIHTRTDQPTDEPAAPTPLRHRRRRWIAGLALGGSVLAAGTAFAIAGLNDSQIDYLEQLEQMTASAPGGGCKFDPDAAALVASADVNGQHLEYWTVDTPTSHTDAIFDDTGGNSIGCGPVPRTEAHPELPWVGYSYGVTGNESTFQIFGQAPAGTRRVTITLWSGVVEADVEPNGYFVTGATLPTVAGDESISITAE
jgi:hypothetical protein